MIEQQAKKATSCKRKEADVHMINKTPKEPKGVVSFYVAPYAQPYQQQIQLA